MAATSRRRNIYLFKVEKWYFFTMGGPLMGEPLEVWADLVLW